MSHSEELNGKQSASTLMGDIPKAAEWFARAMDTSGYPLDGTLESSRELDRFGDEQSHPFLQCLFALYQCSCAIK